MGNMNNFDAFERCDCYNYKSDRSVETLKKHLGDDICVKVPKLTSKDILKVSKEKLRKGELSAEIYSVGCYAIRDSEILYKDDAEVGYIKRVPASDEQVDEYFRQRKEMPLCSLIDVPDCRVVRVIHAAYKNDPNPKWHLICLATSAKTCMWFENIKFVGTVKKDMFTTDKDSDLFVMVQYTGDSFSTETWYRYSPDKVLKEYRIHPYDSESFERKWE